MAIQKFELDDKYYFTKEEIEDHFFTGFPNICLSKNKALPFFRYPYHHTDWKFAQKIIKGLIEYYSIYTQKDIEGFNEEMHQNFLLEMNQPAVKHQKAPPKVGYVYFLQIDNKLTKIGRSINPKDRINQICSQIPFESKINYIIKTSDYIQLEMKFHELFKSKRKHGEWFKLITKDIVKIKLKSFPQDILDLIIEEN